MPPTNIGAESLHRAAAREARPPRRPSRPGRRRGRPGEFLPPYSLFWVFGGLGHRPPPRNNPQNNPSHQTRLPWRGRVARCRRLHWHRLHPLCWEGKHNILSFYSSAVYKCKWYLQGSGGVSRGLSPIGASPRREHHRVHDRVHFRRLRSRVPRWNNDDSGPTAPSKIRTKLCDCLQMTRRRCMCIC